MLLCWRRRSLLLEPSERGKSEKASTHIGLEGSKRTMPASPDFMNLGAASVVLPAHTTLLKFKTFANVSISSPVRPSTFENFGELARDVAVEHGRVAVADLSGVAEDNDLGCEVLHAARGLVLRVGDDVATPGESYV